MSKYVDGIYRHRSGVQLRIHVSLDILFSDLVFKLHVKEKLESIQAFVPLINQAGDLIHTYWSNQLS